MLHSLATVLILWILFMAAGLVTCMLIMFVLEIAHARSRR